MKMAFSRLQITVIRALGGVRRQLVAVATGLQPLAVRAWMHLRHPTRRGVALALAAVPLLVLLYALLLIPFTPGIDDLRKAKLEAPAVVLSADGRELAVFKRANRDWVKLRDIAPDVLAALIATEDRRFYEHHGIDFRRTAGAALGARFRATCRAAPRSRSSWRATSIRSRSAGPPA